MDEAALLGDDLAHVAIDGRDAAAVGDLHRSAVASGPAGGDDLSVCRGDDRASPGRADVEAGVEAREVQDRMVAIAEIGCDMAVHRPGHSGRNLLRLSVARGVDPLASAVGVPFDQLDLALADAVEARVKQVRARGEDHVEAGVGRNVANVDLRRQRREILRRHLRRSSGRAERPVKPVADPPADPQWATGDLRLRRSGCNRLDWNHAMLDKLDRLNRFGRSHAHSRRSAGRNSKRLPLPLIFVRNRADPRHGRPGDAAAQQRQNACGLPARSRQNEGQSAGARLPPERLRVIDGHQHPSGVPK
jgi:hypothetical protein